MNTIFKPGVKPINRALVKIGKTRRSIPNRAQVKANIYLANQEDAERKFNEWKSGQLPEAAFKVIVWGVGPIRRADARIGNLSIGPMGRIRTYGADAKLTLVDIDRKKSPTLERIRRVSRVIGVSVDWACIARSSSGRWHLIVRWKERFSDMERIAVQLMLGSDWKREMHGFYRLRSGTKSKRWNFLFSEKLK